MLFFVDQQNLVKIVRVSPDATGKRTRSRVGKFYKKTLERELDDGAKFSDSEIREIDDVIEVYSRSNEMRRQHHALSFPEIVRETMEYFEARATEAERELITTAVSEAVRRIRRVDQESAG
jgi:hypothetical protein